MTFKEIEDKLFSHFLYIPTLPVKAWVDGNILDDDGNMMYFGSVKDCYIEHYVESEYREGGVLMSTDLSNEARAGDGFDWDDVNELTKIYPTLDIDALTDAEILQKFKSLKWQTAIFLVIG